METASAAVARAEEKQALTAGCCISTRIAEGLHAFFRGETGSRLNRFRSLLVNQPPGPLRQCMCVSHPASTSTSASVMWYSAEPVGML